MVRPDSMKCTADVYFSLHIPAAVIPEPMRYDSVRSLIAKSVRHTVTGVSVVHVLSESRGYPVLTR